MDRLVRGRTERGTPPRAPTLRRGHRPSAAPVALLHGYGRRRDGPEDRDRQRRDEPRGQGHDGEAGDDQEGPGGVAQGPAYGVREQRPPGGARSPDRHRAQPGPREADQREQSDGPHERAAGDPGPRGLDVHPDRGRRDPPGDSDEPPAAHGRAEVRDELQPAAALMAGTTPQMPCPGGEGRRVGDESETGHGDPYTGEQGLGEESEALAAEHGGPATRLHTRLRHADRLT